MPKPQPVREEPAASKSAAQERARGASGATVETVAKRARREYSAAEKLRIVKAADECLASGVRGALETLLRKEGIYSSLLSSWRAQLGLRGSEGLHPRKVGRKPKVDAKDRRNAELERRNAELQRKLRVATALLELQKKAHELLGVALPPSDGDF